MLSIGACFRVISLVVVGLAGGVPGGVPAGSSCVYGCGCVAVACFCFSTCIFRVFV